MRYPTAHLQIPTLKAKLPIVDTCLPPATSDADAKQERVMNGDRPAAEVNRFFADVREMIKACGPKPNETDVVINVIVACLEEGIDRGHRIVGVLDRLGYNRQHVGMTLHHKADAGRTKALWWQDEDKVYRLVG